MCFIQELVRLIYPCYIYSHVISEPRFSVSLLVLGPTIPEASLPSSSGSPFPAWPRWPPPSPQPNLFLPQDLCTCFPPALNELTHYIEASSMLNFHLSKKTCSYNQVKQLAMLLPSSFLYSLFSYAFYLFLQIQVVFIVHPTPHESEGYESMDLI